MRFSEISISNYRQFKRIKFSFDKSKSCDLHVVVASNGVGKTNLLNSINWCLYGDEPHSSGVVGADKKDKLNIGNITAIREAKESAQKTIDVCVCISAEDGDEKYEFERTAVINVETGIQIGKDDFQIKITPKSGGTEYLEDDAAKELVNKFLPQKIREYFYFDGDQLFNYFDDDPKKVSHVKDSIYEIAQVNIVRSVRNHLDTMMKELRVESSAKSSDLEWHEKRLVESAKNIETKKDDIEKLKAQIDESRKEITKLNGILNGTESVVEDNERYETNKLEIERYGEKLEEKHKKLCELIRKYIVKIFLYKVNQSTSAYISEREDEGAFSLDADIDVIQKSLNDEECAVCGSKLDAKAMEHLQDLLNKIGSNSSTQKLAQIKNEVNNSLDISQYQSEKEELFDEIQEIEAKVESLEDDNRYLYGKITSVGDIGGIEVAMKQKIANEQLIERNIELVGSYKEKLNQMEENHEELDKKYKDALSKNEECHDIMKCYEFVESAHDIVKQVEEEIVNDVKSSMEKLTMQRFNELLWKKDTYGHIELDDNFKLKLFHKLTNASCLNSCSAAEKELLALAFTLALHEVSGYDNLLFIDSPVGRVSDMNRENFAKVLLGVSESKQIILAFTPSEYSDEISSVLSESAISSYSTLRTDERATVKED